jgi:hypothetical protein
MQAQEMPLHSRDHTLRAAARCNQAVAFAQGIAQCARCRSIDDLVERQFRGITDNVLDILGVDLRFAARVKRQLLHFAARQSPIGTQARKQDLASFGCDRQAMRIKDFAYQGLQSLRLIGVAGHRSGGRYAFKQLSQRIAGP